MSGPHQAKTIAEMRSLSDDELARQYDALAQSTAVGIGYYLAELERRQGERQTRALIRLTWVIAVFTAVSVVATIVNLTP